MKAKPILIIIVTLIIGFVLGMLTSAQIRFHRLSPVKVYFSEERFRDGFFKTIQPDELQKTKIEQILDKYAIINSELHNSFRKDLDASMLNFRKELDQNLTKEQLTRLKEMDMKREEMTREYRKKRENDTLRSKTDRRRNIPDKSSKDSSSHSHSREGDRD